MGNQFRGFSSAADSRVGNVFIEPNGVFFGLFVYLFKLSFQDERFSLVALFLGSVVGMFPRCVFFFVRGISCRGSAAALSVRGVSSLVSSFSSIHFVINNFCKGNKFETEAAPFPK